MTRFERAMLSINPKGGSNSKVTVPIHVVEERHYCGAAAHKREKSGITCDQTILVVIVLMVRRSYVNTCISTSYFHCIFVAIMFTLYMYAYLYCF